MWIAAFVAVAGATSNATAETASALGSDPRIVGGQEVSPYAFTFVVGVLGDPTGLCGGSLISRQWVLTAAHCIDSSTSYYALIYAHSLSLEGSDSCTQLIAVEEIICHEDYTGGDQLWADMEADICLLRLAQEPTCAEAMEAAGQLARLDDGASGRDRPGTTVTVAGWGHTIQDDEDSSPDQMHYVTKPMVDFSACNAAYAELRGPLVEGSMICAGEQEGGEDTCQGDSGGPLFVEEDDGSFVQVGVVSFGVGCGVAGYPGVYASVAHHLPWIIDKITSAAPSPPLCSSTCVHASDSVCDDGGLGSEFSACDFGTDCTKCGTRGGGTVCYDTCTDSFGYGDCAVCAPPPLSPEADGDNGGGSGGGGDNPCFPSTSLVTLADGKSIRLDELQVGVAIMAAREDGRLTYDVVSALSIAKPTAVTKYFKVEAGSLPPLTVTPEHRLPVGESCCSNLKRAADLEVGDTIWSLALTDTARPVTVTKISPVIARGTHSPVLVGGSFPVVDGIITCFDSLNVVRTARALLWMVEPLLFVASPTHAIRLLNGAPGRAVRRSRRAEGRQGQEARVE